MGRDLKKERLQEANMMTDGLLGLGARIAARRLKAGQREENRLASERGDDIPVDPTELILRGMGGVNPDDITGMESRQLERPA